MITREADRIEHGMALGAIASVVSGLVVLVAVAFHLWPTGRPLSVLVVEMVGRDYLGRQGSKVATWLLAGVLQVSWGALCGGAMALLTERVTLANAVGFGALRWFWTQVMIAPALGWGDFGFLHLPAVAPATLLPHAVYVLCLGWMMHQEEEGRAPIPLHFHWPSLHWRPLAVGRGRRH
jgi:hypothetical protein